MPGGRNKKSKSHGVYLKHTNVVLDLDISNRTVQGYVELRLRSKLPITTIKFHARQMRVEKVLFNDEETEFEYVDFLTQPCASTTSRSVINNFL